MKKATYLKLEPGDKIYISFGDEPVDITLTESHINNQSTVNPSFIYANLRLKSPKIDNNQVQLEEGSFYDDSVGMSVDYGYRFKDSNIKAFISKEALNQYLNEQLKELKMIKSSIEQLEDIIRPHINSILQLIEEYIEHNESIGISRNKLLKFEDYQTIDNLHQYIRQY